MGFLFASQKQYFFRINAIHFLFCVTCKTKLTNSIKLPFRNLLSFTLQMWICLRNTRDSVNTCRNESLCFVCVCSQLFDMLPRRDINKTDNIIRWGFFTHNNRNCALSFAHGFELLQFHSSHVFKFCLITMRTKILTFT